MRNDLDTEPRAQRLKRTKRRWPKWLRSRVVRWALILGPLALRVWRLLRDIRGSDGG